jgi:hypothetical protein
MPDARSAQRSRGAEYLLEARPASAGMVLADLLAGSARPCFGGQAFAIAHSRSTAADVAWQFRGC